MNPAPTNRAIRCDLNGYDDDHMCKEKYGMNNCCMKLTVISENSNSATPEQKAMVDNLMKLGYPTNKLQPTASFC